MNVIAKLKRLQEQTLREMSGSEDIETHMYYDGMVTGFSEAILLYTCDPSRAVLLMSITRTFAEEMAGRTDGEFRLYYDGKSWAMYNAILVLQGRHINKGGVEEVTECGTR